MSQHETMLNGPSKKSFAWIGTLAGLLAGFGLFLALLGMLQESPLIVRLGGYLVIAGLSVGLLVRQLANYRFTLWILIANLAALIAPHWFLTLGGFSLTDSWLLLVLVQLIMFGMGTQMSVRDFLNVARMPYGVVVGLFSQLLIMPLLGFTLARTFAFPPEIGAGLILTVRDISESIGTWGGSYRIRCIVTAEQALPLGVRDRCTLGPTRHTHNVIDTGTEIDVAFPILTGTSRIGIARASIQGHNLGNQTVGSTWNIVGSDEKISRQVILVVEC